MIYEYLIFNIIVLSGPLLLGWLKPFYFLNRWPKVLASAVLVSIPYLVWDSLVTGLHWEFNFHYTTGLVVLNLPIEEILFFITVPAACLFTWEMISRRMDEKPVSFMNRIRPLFYLLPVAGTILLIYGKQYTGLATFFLGLAVALDQVIKTNLLLQKRFMFFFALSLLFTLVFNGYLTWRPVVVYNELYQLDLRIFTIPIEDFWYGFSMIYFNTILYEKFRTRKSGSLKLA